MSALHASSAGATSAPAMPKSRRRLERAMETDPQWPDDGRDLRRLLRLLLRGGRWIRSAARLRRRCHRDESGGERSTRDDERDGAHPTPRSRAIERVVLI